MKFRRHLHAYHPHRRLRWTLFSEGVRKGPISRGWPFRVSFRLSENETRGHSATLRPSPSNIVLDIGRCMIRIQTALPEDLEGCFIHGPLVMLV